VAQQIPTDLELMFVFLFLTLIPGLFLRQIMRHNFE